eukprot:TRINITY_DN9480_c0_g1_i1.p1 TRINITY_DN9480_c0_g1~~TRINITY_DN9480_c0_g1_i1.p1  ORF type:complete len:737 (+),score=252.71 TRINITY_DN9480_c0_g1_i1:49-2259(+)
MRPNALRGVLGMATLVIFYTFVASISIGGVGISGEDAGGNLARHESAYREVTGAPSVDPVDRLSAVPVDDKKFNRAFMKNMKSLGKILKAKHRLDLAFQRDETKKRPKKKKGKNTPPPPPGKHASPPANETAAPDTSTFAEMALKKKRIIGQRMLNDLEDGIMEKARQLSDLMRNLSDAGMKERLETRLQDLQEKSIRARDDLEELLSIEREEAEMRKRVQKNSTSSQDLVGGLVENIDGELGRAIHALKAELREGAAWSKARDSKDHTVETVMKIEHRDAKGIMPHYRALLERLGLGLGTPPPAASGGSPPDTAEQKGAAATGVMSTLVDHENNQYVLSLPHDLSIHYEDHHFAQDIGLVVGACFALSMAARALRLPHFFGFIAAGCLLSPTELNKIHNLVQLETLARYGVCLLLFLLGVEFNYDKLVRVWHTAVLGGVAMASIIILASTVLLHVIFLAPASEGIVLGFCFSLSSTAVAMRCLSEYEVPEAAKRVLIGVLVTQDVSLGIMVAMIPNLTQLGQTASAWVVVQPFASLALLASVALLSSARLAVPVARMLQGEKELLLMYLLTYAIVFMQAGEEVGLSAEVGAFLAGLAFASDPEVQHVGTEVLKPLQDFFVCFFFAAIGFHLYPSFLIREMTLLLSLTLLVVCSKYIVALVVFRQVCRMEVHPASLVSLGLSQMSEFSFVVAAHAKAHGLISNEMYFMLLGTTALSLPTTPLLWRLHDTESSVKSA